MIGTNRCYSCGKPCHMVKDFPIRRSQEKGRERVQSNGPMEEDPTRQWFFVLKFRVHGKALLVMSRVSSLN